MAETYTDLLIHIRGRREALQGYPVEASLDDGSFFFGRLDEEAVRQAAEQVDQTAYGRGLYGALFAGPVGRALNLATGAARQQSGGRLRVRLWLAEEAPELHGLRWELLAHERQGDLVPLSTTAATPFSRYTGLGTAEPQPVDQTGGLRMLVAVANPEGLADYSLAAIDTSAELASLAQALGDLPGRGTLQVTVLPGRASVPDGTDLPDRQRAELEAAGYTVLDDRLTSLENLLRLLADEKPFHILHFLGHGSFSQRNQRHALFLEHEGDAINARGQVDLVTEDRLLDGLRGLEHVPHLTVLMACESGKTAVGRALAGLSYKLTAAGAPAVVAMQDVIAMDAARQLTGDFYRRLLRHGLVDVALNEARHLLFEKDDGHWAVPLLTMRLRSGQLFTPDPVQATLAALAAEPTFNFFAREHGRYVPLPIEVIRASSENYAALSEGGTARMDLMKALEDGLTEPDPEAAVGKRPRVTALIGDYGSNKSFQLSRLVWRTIRQSQADPTARLLPVHVDLRRYQPERATVENPLESFILRALAPYWPDPDADRLSELPRQLRLRIVLRGLDEMAEPNRQVAWEQFLDLLDDLRQHGDERPLCQFALAGRPNTVDWSVLDNHARLQILVVQPLNHVKIRHFLENLPTLTNLYRAEQLSDTACRQLEAAGQRLLDVLHQSELFDLAATPRFMLDLLWAAEHGRVPASRTEALDDLIQDALARVAPGQGRRSRAAQTIYGLAWAMQTAGMIQWPLEDAFQIMGQVRGTRGYSLETLYDEFRQHGLLEEVGGNAVRFAYPAYQEYCCAQAILARPDPQRALDDVMATLGSPQKLDWWAGTLVVVSGLLAQACAEGQSSERLARFLEAIIYGTNLLDGETLFLAGRCLLECRACSVDDNITGLQRHAVKAMEWRADEEHEPHLAHRVRTTQLLSQLADPAVIVSLAQIVYRKIRHDIHGEADYEFSSVRMAAAIGLKRVRSRHKVNQVLGDIDPALPQLFTDWREGRTRALVHAFYTADNPGLQALIALALGDLASQAGLIQDAEGGQTALDCLAEALVAADTDTAVRWALADALSMIDPQKVIEQVVVPYLEAVKERSREEWADWISRDKRLIYLIGLLRWQDDRAHHFLVKQCLPSCADVKLWLTVIDALGRLANDRDRHVLEAIATVSLGYMKQWFPVPDERLRLQRKAISALARLGSLETLERLRAAGLDEEDSLLAPLYETGFELYWRRA
ncbi:MAG: CHAT domain-containing protein [Candidatus Promineifilaceae bacterium]|nr:CHAT domain-containing protein [Candidatus Promineifilaceae bacterium]